MIGFGVEAKDIQPVLQAQVQECGLACLTMIANVMGHNFDLPYLKSRYPVSASGVSISSLIEIARDIGIEADAYSLDKPELLEKLTLPSIIHWEGNHFVVLEKLTARQCTVFDPAHGKRYYKKSEIFSRFSGYALELSPKIDFKQINIKSRIGFLSILKIMWALNRRFRRS